MQERRLYSRHVFIKIKPWFCFIGDPSVSLVNLRRPGESPVNRDINSIPIGILSKFAGLSSVILDPPHP